MGRRKEWTRLGSSSNMGRNGGLSGPGEGRLSVLGWIGQEEGSGVCRLLTTATAQKLEHAGRKQVNAGLMGISIAALKQSCKQWKAVRAIL